MNFKRLEIYGFKSFADKTAVEFNEGITGIVGPNGSGKSNFSDAIKWVLGEQRPSELRGKNMQDVIFNGTQRRGAMSYCEVTLVFDNTGKKLFPTLEFDEVAISRKIYRSGDSEYLLNKENCRLKDIKDIIADTGLGKDGYSIIGQGKVAKIINSKPEDRRAIFEDAAGISKYKARKIEAENKLTRTEEHLDKLIFIITDLEKRLTPLENQSKNAKLYYQYCDELKKIEINHYMATYNKTKVSKTQISDILIGISDEMKLINKDLINLDISYNDKLIKITEIDELIKDLNNRKTDMLLDNERRLGDNKQYNERLNSQKEQLINLTDNLARMKSQLADYKQEIANIKDKRSEAVTDLAKCREEYNNSTRTFEKLVDDIFTREKEIEHGNKAIFETMDMLVGVKSDFSKISAESEMLQQKKGENEYLVDRTKKMIENDESQRSIVNERLLSSKAERDKAYSNRIRLRNTINESKFKENSLVSELNQLNGSISSYETKIKLLKNIKEQYEGYQAPLQRLMNEAKSNPELSRRIMGIVAEVIKVPSNLEIAIETALGAAMQNVITQNDDDVKYIIEILKQKHLGRLTFLPITTFKARELGRENAAAVNEIGALGIACKIIKYDSKYDLIFSGLLGTTLIVDNYDNAVKIFKKYRQSFRIVTLDGEVLNTQGSISGGSRKADAANLLSRDRELEQSIVSLDRTRKEYDNKTTAVDDIRKCHSDAMQALTEVEEELNKREIEYATITEREVKISDNLDRLSGELSDYIKLRSEIDSRLDLLNYQLQSVDKLEGDITGQRVSADDINTKTKQIFEEKTKEKDLITEQMSNFRVQISSLDGIIVGFDADIERIIKDINNTESSIAIDEEVYGNLEANIKTTENRLSNSIISDAEKEKLNKINTNIQECELSKIKINQDIIDINQKKTDNNHNINELTEKKVKQEAQLERIEGNMLAMSQRLLEEYGLDHTAAMELSDLDYSDDGAVTAIANTKRKITNLGIINTAAIEEYEIVRENYTKYTSERDDLLKAEADLRTIIKDLSREMLERFNVEFDKISANFQITFREIFGGGQGQLIIDKNAEDPLSAGVEIYAQPPGKKLQQISLFSGGEMSLTAIAILFAILRNKPMPFCVLDEIEAALDESNVRLFAKYLKRFIQDTQFIVITHRKPTMEQADRLYGVTMEEKGVSKVVKVEFEDAVKTIDKEVQKPAIV